MDVPTLNTSYLALPFRHPSPSRKHAVLLWQCRKKQRLSPCLVTHTLVMLPFPMLGYSRNRQLPERTALLSWTTPSFDPVIFQNIKLPNPKPSPTWVTAVVSRHEYEHGRRECTVPACHKVRCGGVREQHTLRTGTDGLELAVEQQLEGGEEGFKKRRSAIHSRLFTGNPIYNIENRGG